MFVGRNVAYTTAETEVNSSTRILRQYRAVVFTVDSVERFVTLKRFNSVPQQTSVRSKLFSVFLLSTFLWRLLRSRVQRRLLEFVVLFTSDWPVAAVCVQAVQRCALASVIRSASAVDGNRFFLPQFCH